LPVREEPMPGVRPSLAGFLNLVKRRDVMVPTLLSTLAQYVAWATTFGFKPILARGLGADGVKQSLLVSGSMVVGIAGNLLSALVVTRIGPRRLVAMAFGVASLGIAVAAFAPTLLVLSVGQFMLGLSQGALYPVLLGMSIEKVDERQRSTAMGVHQAVYGIGMTAGPAVSGIIAEAVGIPTMFLVTAAICLTAGLVGARFLATARGETRPLAT
ncbi:MAG: MFS transporter, partial [Anaerolineae bacterium]|nr:MFS transporter [Anaerolineae bacterium]